MTTLLIESLPGKESTDGPVEEISLTWQDRSQPRMRCTTSAGTEVALALPRGTNLMDGTVLYSSSERSIVVRAEPEEVLLIEPQDAQQGCLVAHHLGNWHRSLELDESGRIIAEHDSPLESWLQKQGLRYRKERRPYNPNVHGHAHG